MSDLLLFVTVTLITCATPVAFYGLQTIGALVLVWMAIKSWRAPAADPASVAAARAVS